MGTVFFFPPPSMCARRGGACPGEGPFVGCCFCVCGSISASQPGREGPPGGGLATLGWPTHPAQARGAGGRAAVAIGPGHIETVHDCHGGGIPGHSGGRAPIRRSPDSGPHGTRTCSVSTGGRHRIPVAPSLPGACRNQGEEGGDGHGLVLVFFLPRPPTSETGPADPPGEPGGAATSPTDPGAWWQRPVAESRDLGGGKRGDERGPSFQRLPHRSVRPVGDQHVQGGPAFLPGHRTRRFGRHCRHRHVTHCPRLRVRGWVWAARRHWVCLDSTLEGTHHLPRDRMVPRFRREDGAAHVGRQIQKELLSPA